MLIPVVLLAALLAFSMCRLAALSDSRHAVAVAEWIATSHFPEQDHVSHEHARERIPFDQRGASFRAAG